MKLTAEQLTTLEEYAASLLSPKEIAILLGIDPDVRQMFVTKCLRSEGSQEYEAYHKGRLTTKLALRRNIIKLAKAGSPAAEPLAEKYLAEQHL